ncbi:MAG: hypothetical protein LBQ43_03730 [Holosporales bacterium]|nr:hypothetical protein [Holosporales bacterium]
MNALKFIPVVLVSCWASCASCSQLPVELSDDEVARAKFALAEATGKSMDEMEGMIQESDRYVTRKFLEFEKRVEVGSSNQDCGYFSEENIAKYVALYRNALSEESEECDVRNKPYKWLLHYMRARASEAHSLDSVIYCWACAVFSCKHRPCLGGIISYMTSDFYKRNDSEIISSPNYGQLNELIMIYENRTLMQYVHGQRAFFDLLGRIWSKLGTFNK